MTTTQHGLKALNNYNCMHTQTSGTFKDMDAKTESAAWKPSLAENSIHTL